MVDRMLNGCEVIQGLVKIRLYQVTVLATIDLLVILDHLFYLVLIVIQFYFAAVQMLHHFIDPPFFLIQVVLLIFDSYLVA